MPNRQTFTELKLWDPIQICDTNLLFCVGDIFDLSLEKPNYHYRHQSWLDGHRDRFHYKEPPYDPNKKSFSFVDPNHPKAKWYFYSGFFGGRVKTVQAKIEKYLKLIENDAKQGIVGARFDDESYVNRLNFEEEPDVVLGPGYMHPMDFDVHPWLWVGWDDLKKPPPQSARLISEVKIGNMGKSEALNFKWH